jgi:predicted dehydrogenase
MATTLEECWQIVKLVNETGLKYMMAETVVYSREFLLLKELHRKGELGKIQYLAASHPQDMDGWPAYWERMIPMR